MKTLIIATAILLCSSPLAAWEHHRIPGGTPLKTLVIDYNVPPLKGVWVCERAGGMYWLEWNNGFYSDYLEYVPYEGFWGGNVSRIDGTITLAGATNNGIYSCECSGGEWGEFVHLPNNYYRFYDAGVWGVNPVNGNRLFIAAAIQQWEPLNNEYIKGVYLLEEDEILQPGAIPVTGSDDHEHGFLYQDLEPEYENIFYTPYATFNSSNFQRITASGVSPDQAGTTVIDDFANYGDEFVTTFYQYVDYLQVPPIYYQYMICWNDAGTESNVWSRSRSFNSGGNFSSVWTPVWNDLQDIFRSQSGEPVMIAGLAAREHIAAPTGHIIYLLMDYYGLVVNLPPNGFTQLNMTPDQSEYLMSYNSKALNRNTLEDSVDELFVGTQYGTQQYVIINREDFHVLECGDFDNWGMGPAGSAFKAGAATYSSFKDTVENLLYHPHLGSGIYKFDLQANHWTKMAMQSVSLEQRPDFNYTWLAVAESPFEDDYLILGANYNKYYLDSNWITHDGLRKIPKDGSGGVEPFGPDVFNGTSVTALLGDPDNRLLYVGGLIPNGDSSPQIFKDATDYFVPSMLVYLDDNGIFDELHSTQDLYAPTYMSPTTYPHYNTLRKHPATGVTGVIFGIGFRFLDGGNDRGSHLPDNYSGGIGYCYRDAGGDWHTPATDPELEIVSCYKAAGTNNPPDSWFEHVHDIEVESTGTEPEDFTVLAATAAWPQSHLTEDFHRYGGLFRISNSLSGWEIDDVTPNTDDYQLNGDPSVDFENPACFAVEAINLNGTKRYFCYTQGEERNSSDITLSLIWYQDADSMGAISAEYWRKLPNEAGIDSGIVAYEAEFGFTNPITMMNAFPNIPEPGGYTLVVSGDGTVGPHIYTSPAGFPLETPVVTIRIDGNDAVLSWDEVTNADLYHIYGGDSPDFIPAPENLIGSVEINTFIDSTVVQSGNVAFFYKVIAGD